MVNEDNLVSILGRRKDMIKRGDFGIMPAALESSIAAFTGSQVNTLKPVKIFEDYSDI